MSVKLIDLSLVKKHLRVTHSASDEHIESLIESAVEEAEDYLDKKVFDDQAAIDAAVGADGVDPGHCIVRNKKINSAIALYVEYHYYGVSAHGADKIKIAAENLLHPDRLLVAY